MAKLRVTSDAETRRHLFIRRFIHLLVAAVVIAPYIWKVTLPGVPSGKVRQVYDGLNGLPPGSAVLFSLDYDPSSKAELEPMTVALFRHCFARGLRPVVMTHWVNGLGLHKDILERVAREGPGAPKISGTDYVLLGFKPGGRDVVLNMGENLTVAFGKDYYGMPTNGMPALENLPSLKKLRYGICIAAGATAGGVWIPFGSDRFGFPLAVGCTAVSAPGLYPFEQSKQITGILGGLRGAADYETLIDRPGDGVSGMTAQSFAHVLIIILIIIANVELYLQHRRQKGASVA